MMQVTRLVFSSLLVVTTLALRLPLATNDKSSKAAAFVINMESRKDRCVCARSMLRDSPYSVSRANAVTFKQYKQQCPEMSKNIVNLHHKAALGLVCSNFVIWETIIADPTFPEFAIIFEDDIHVKDPKFWDTLDEFLQNSSTTDWDYLYVDPIHDLKCSKDVCHLAQEKKITESEMQEANNFHMCTKADIADGGFMRDAFSGSHMMIVRAKSASKLIEVAKTKISPMDKFARNAVEMDVKVGMWTPGMVAQLSAGSNKHHKQVPPECSKSITASDLKFARPIQTQQTKREDGTELFAC